MTLRTIADRIIRMYYRGAPPQEQSLDIREVEAHVKDVMAAVIRKRLFEDRQAGEFGIKLNDGSFTATFKDVAILKDSTTEEKYSVLPAMPVAMPSGRGIVEVSDKKSGGRRSFYPIDLSDVPMFFAQGGIPKKVFYRREGNRIIYYGDIAQTTVQIKMVAPFGDDNEVIADGGIVAETISGVFNILMGEKKIPRDVTDEQVER